jgi:hypothetical protein
MSEEKAKKGRKKGSSKSFTLCFLDKKTKLVASDHAFVIKERIKTKDDEAVWVGKYFYSDVADAIRGFARHALRKPELVSKLDGSIENLIKVLEDLDKTIVDIAEKVKNTLAHEKGSEAEGHSK